MNEEIIDKRILVLVLLATLVIRLLAWGADGGATVYAGRLNQTIPTPTPSRLPGTPSTPGPTEPTPTRTPSSAPTVPSAPSPSPSPRASATPTGQMAGGTATSTSTATAIPAVATATPVGGGQIPTPVQPATSTLPAIASPSSSFTPTVLPAGTGTPGLPAQDTVVPATPTVAPTWTTGAVSSPAVPTPLVTPEESRGAAGVFASGSSCIWVALGLVLVVIGIVILVRWLRSK